MARIDVAIRPSMTLDEFLAWEEQQEARFEFDGFGPVERASLIALVRKMPHDQDQTERAARAPITMQASPNPTRHGRV